MIHSKDRITVGLVSITATSNKKSNVEKALTGATEAHKRGADWIFLPEMFSFHGPYDQLWDQAEYEDGPLNQELSQFSKQNGIILFAGSVGERPAKSSSGKVYNTQYVFGRDGDILAKYRKTHLFNLISASGEPLYCESDGYMAGDKLVTVNVDGWLLGLATCYDLRFPEYFAALGRHQPLDGLVIPSAFTLQTGMYHWSTLLRARAIEHLCFVIAANQVGQHSPGKTSFGHACVIDPWGTTLADSGNREAVVIAEIDKQLLTTYRSQLPALKNRRPELY